MSKWLQRIRHRVFGGSTSYEEGLQDEASFWRRALANDGKFWSPEAYRERLNPMSEFQPHLRELVERSPYATAKRVRVLDVGAGPLTAVGRHWPGRDVELVAADPLAKTFDAILDELGINPPTRTIVASGEALTEVFPADAFEVVVCGNALDHSRDPLLCLQQMRTVTRPGGWVFLWHFRNEAQEEGYSGLHQWNLDMSADGDLIVWSKKSRHSARDLFGRNASVDCRPDPQVPRAIITRIQKLPAEAAPAV
jgi:SAM-dependent methyltransferase